MSVHVSISSLFRAILKLLGKGQGLFFGQRLPKNSDSSLGSISSSSLIVTKPVGQLVGKILAIHSELVARKKLKDLKPSAEVNALFGQLVAACTQIIETSLTQEVMEDYRLDAIKQSLRRICAEGEAALEAQSVDIILGIGDAARDEESVFERLTAFPYYQNYLDLTRMELAAIYASTSTETECPKKIAFIGSGPLPLSSLCMLDILSSRFSPFSSISTATQNPKGPVTILNIDNDHLAISKSSQLCQQLGAKGTGMEFLCTDANGQEYDLGDCDVVFLAALVGESQEEKEALLENVAKKMRSGALLLIRSADRQRILMYPEFDPTTDRVQAILEVCVALHPYNHVVNSVIVGRVRGNVPCTGTGNKV